MSRWKMCISSTTILWYMELDGDIWKVDLEDHALQVLVTLWPLDVRSSVGLPTVPTIYAPTTNLISLLATRLLHMFVDLLGRMVCTQIMLVPMLCNMSIGIFQLLHDSPLSALVLWFWNLVQMSILALVKQNTGFPNNVADLNLQPPRR